MIIVTSHKVTEYALTLIVLALLKHDLRLYDSAYLRYKRGRHCQM